MSSGWRNFLLRNIGQSSVYLIRNKKNKGCGTECHCRYPDTNVRDILIDYELEKAKKLDTAIHKLEDENEKN